MTYDYATNGGYYYNNSQTYKTLEYNIAYKSKVSLTNTNMNGSKSYYTFVGWNTDPNATEGITEITMELEPITVYAIYRKTVTMTYYGNRGIENKTTSYILYNNDTKLEITHPEPTTYEGWTFNGYSTNAANKEEGIKAGTKEKIEIPITTTTYTYYHTWKKDVTITFKANGGKEDKKVKGTIYNGSTRVKLTTPEATTYTGWELIGYATTATATSASYQPNTEYNFSFSSTSTELTYYHVWKKTVTVTFDANGGAANKTATKTIYNGAKTATVTTPTATTFNGWTFVGYNVEKNATTGIAATHNCGATVSETNRSTTSTPSGTVYIIAWKCANGHGSSTSSTGSYPSIPSSCPEIQTTSMTVDVADTENSATVYCIWKKTIAISFIKNVGGTTETINQTLYNGATTTTVKAPEPTEYVGWTFNGYATSSSEKSGKYFGGDTIEITISNTTTSFRYYYTWKKDITITLDKNGGLEDKVIKETLYNGATSITVTMPEATTRVGYTFKGYGTSSTATSGTLEGKTRSVSIPVKENTATLYHTWTANSYTIKYDGNGSTGGSTSNSTHKFDTSKALTTNGYSKTGHTFANWNTKADGTGTSYKNGETVLNLTSTASEIITLYAQWTPKVYMMTLNNRSATLAGTSAVYLKYNEGVYLESACVTKLTTTQNKIMIPTKTGYKFDGYYTSSTSGTQLIDANGKITSNFTPTLYTAAKTLYAHWTKQ